MIVSQASTLILEGLLCNKSVCVPTFIGIKANIGYDRLVDGYQHYIGFKLMNNFYAPKTEHDLEKTILRCLNQKNNSSNLNLDWICQNSKYETEITNVINEISK